MRQRWCLSAKGRLRSKRRWWGHRNSKTIRTIYRRRRQRRDHRMGAVKVRLLFEEWNHISKVQLISKRPRRYARAPSSTTTIFAAMNWIPEDKQVHQPNDKARRQSESHNSLNGEIRTSTLNSKTRIMTTGDSISKIQSLGIFARRPWHRWLSLKTAMTWNHQGQVRTEDTNRRFKMRHRKIYRRFKTMIRAWHDHAPLQWLVQKPNLRRTIISRL